MSTDTELQAMTVRELYALAKAHGIAGRSAMRKAELIDALETSESYQQTLEPEADAPALTRERAEELVLAAELANDWPLAERTEILDEVAAVVTPDDIESSGSTRADVMQAYRIVIGEADPADADEGGAEPAGDPACVYCRACPRESIASGVPYCEACVPEPEYTVAVPKQYGNAPLESEITIGITALGGGTVSNAYANSGWQWQVRENSTVVLFSGDLRANMTPATHNDMARTLAAFLSADAEVVTTCGPEDLDTAYTQAQRDFLESYGERLAAFAHDPCNQ